MDELKILMITNKVTQKKFAEEIGISQQTLSNYLNGKTQPDFDLLIKFADYFNVSIDKMLGHKVKYFFDKSSLTQEQQKIFEKIKTLSDENCKRATDFIDGLLVAEQEKEQIIQNFKKGV